MTDEQIAADRNSRVDQCKTEIETSLKKYEMALIAEDNITPSTKISVNIQFVDIKKYDAIVAQPVSTVVSGVSAPDNTSNNN